MAMAIKKFIISILGIIAAPMKRRMVVLVIQTLEPTDYSLQPSRVDKH
jgi:hypothetical protein